MLLIDPDRIAVMGESAGGYLASVCALTNGDKQYDVGPNLDVSSDVQASIPWYSGALRRPDTEAKKQDSKYKRSDRKWIDFDGQLTSGGINQHVRMDNLPDLPDLIKKDTVPFCLLHGTADELVSAERSEIMYTALQNAGVYARLYLIKDAGHQDRRFVEESVKARLLDFLNTALA